MAISDTDMMHIRSMEIGMQIGTVVMTFTLVFKLGGHDDLEYTLGVAKI